MNKMNFNTTKIIREPGSGKTKEIMSIAETTGAVFVCKNPEAMQVKADAYGINPIIIGYETYLTDSVYEDKKICIDDIDEFLLLMGMDNILVIGGNL